jgi:hypothetical protein
MPDTAPQSVEDLIKMVQEALEKEEASTETNRSFAEATNAEMTEIKEKLAAQEARNAALERQLELQVVSQTMTEIHSFSDALVTEGKLPPALKARAETLLAIVANLEGEVKSYALGDSGEDGELSPFALVTELLNSLPVNTLLKPIDKSGDGKALARLNASGKADVRRYSVDTEASTEMYGQIKALQTEKGISYMQAFEQIKREAIDSQG